MRLNLFFQMTSYSLWKAAVVETFNFIGSFCWAYVDVFIMVNGIALSSKFKQISFKIHQYVQMEVSDLYLWKILREDYFDLCILTKTVDKSLSNLVLLTSINNFYYILSQRFYNVEDMQHYGLKVCFIFSFTLSVTRTICVYLFSASVNLESTKPLKALCRIEPDIYNIEVERLIRLIGSDTVYITGKNFFNIRRGILLDIANALVTCEIVLVQYFGKSS
ncbi:gustatory receptor for sugar taste 64f-like [Agrilus planipennis]|uniref:Gustatory receptor for sugar taste 64f-like n=1 Tax=Agrilus planipennis TaxID=224129 RepID=A0A1W4XRW4_AGRPL|nr:gustatory receptor for sugar taste 64f-like [Agrilus planipennis]